MRKLKSRRQVKWYYYTHKLTGKKVTETRPDGSTLYRLFPVAKGADYSGHGINTRKILRGRIAEQKKILANLQST